MKTEIRKTISFEFDSTESKALAILVRTGLDGLSKETRTINPSIENLAGLILRDLDRVER